MGAINFMVSNEEGLDEMSLAWQVHDQRITNMEQRVVKVEASTDNMMREVREIKESIASGNRDTSDKLDNIHEQLLGEFFRRKSIGQKERWKFAGLVTTSSLGGGGIIYVILQLLLK